MKIQTSSIIELSQLEICEAIKEYIKTNKNTKLCVENSSIISISINCNQNHRDIENIFEAKNPITALIILQ